MREQKVTEIIFSISAPGRGITDSLSTSVLADPARQDEGEVREGVRRVGARPGRVQEGRRGSEPLEGRGGEAAHELHHQNAAVRGREERVRQPAAENK